MNTDQHRRWEPPSRLTIPEGLLAQVEQRPDKPAVWFPDEAFSYAQMWERVTAIAAGLSDLGVGRGDYVAVLMRNSSDQLFTWFATAVLGAIYVPINTAYVGAYLRYPLETVSASVLVVDEHLAAEAVAVLPDVPSVRHLVVRGDDPAQFSNPTTSVHSMGGLHLTQRRTTFTTDPTAWKDPNAVLFTAGTTGPSKGALITQNCLMQAAAQLLRARDGRPDDIYYNPLPLFHGNAMILGALGPLLTGATAAFEENFSVSRFWDRIRHYGATQVSILGPLLMMLWKQPPRPDDADNPARVLVAVPVPAELHRPIEDRFGVRIAVAYGLSECVPITVSQYDEPLPPGTSGKASPLFDVALLDEDDAEVATGEVGEIACRPRQPHVMFEGYLNNPAATVGMWRNLWFHTGDLGRLDEHGNLSFVDRKKDYLRRRGENISSFEVERAILAHPDILEAAVLGVPSALSEEDVMAFVVARAGAVIGPVDLMEHCAANMPYFAVPRYLEFVDALPKNPVGRVQKFTLRERGVTPTTFDREAEGFVVVRKDRRRQPDTVS